MARSQQIASPATAPETGRDFAATALAYFKRAAADKKQVEHFTWVRLTGQPSPCSCCSQPAGKSIVTCPNAKRVLYVAE